MDELTLVPGPKTARFEAVFSDLYVPLVHLATAMVDDRAVAEEVVQDGLGRLWERFDEVDNPGGYLRTSVVNGCRAVLRRREVKRRRDPVAASPSRHHSDQQYLLDALDVLAENTKTALVLRYYGDFSLNEIAETMGIPLGTVKSLIHRGLNDLRKAIE